MKKLNCVFLLSFMLTSCVTSTAPAFANPEKTPITIAVHDNESGATVYMACTNTRSEVQYESAGNKYK